MSQIYLNGITLEELATALAPLLTQALPNQAQPPTELLTREEACKLLSINYTSLWKHTKSGRLPRLCLGNRVYYRREDLLNALTKVKR